MSLWKTCPIRRFRGEAGEKRLSIAVRLAWCVGTNLPFDATKVRVRGSIEILIQFSTGRLRFRAARIGNPRRAPQHTFQFKRTGLKPPNAATARARDW
jgi:hypothetical protein